MLEETNWQKCRVWIAPFILLAVFVAGIVWLHSIAVRADGAKYQLSEDDTNVLNFRVARAQLYQQQAADAQARLKQAQDDFDAAWKKIKEKNGWPEGVQISVDPKKPDAFLVTEPPPPPPPAKPAPPAPAAK